MAGGQPAEGSRRRAGRTWVEGERFPGNPLFLWTALLAALPLVLLSILSVWGVLAWGVTLTAVGVVLAVLLSLALTRLTVQWVVSRPLRESEQRYRTLVAQSFGLICTHDAQGVLQMVNPAGRTGWATRRRSWWAPISAVCSPRRCAASSRPIWSACGRGRPRRA